MPAFGFRNSRRVGTVAVAAMSLVVGTAALAGPEDAPVLLDSEPLFADEGESLRAVGEFHGVSRKHGTRVSLLATAEVKVECSRSGEHSFQEVFEFTLEAVERIPIHQIKGNRVDIDIETEQAKLALFAWYGPQGGCPNGWSHSIAEVDFLDAKVEIQHRQTVVVEWLCSFAEPTRDGTIQPEEVDCELIR